MSFYIISFEINDDYTTLIVLFRFCNSVLSKSNYTICETQILSDSLEGRKIVTNAFCNLQKYGI